MSHRGQSGSNLHSEDQSRGEHTGLEEKDQSGIQSSCLFTKHCGGNKVNQNPAAVRQPL